MTVYSMTGYASCQSPATQNTQPGEPAQVGIGLEIRSVNSRFLDLSFRVSDELRSAEPVMRDHITKHLKRGKVEVRAWIERQQDGTQAVPDTASLDIRTGVCYAMSRETLLNDERLLGANPRAQECHWPHSNIDDLSDLQEAENLSVGYGGILIPKGGAF